MAAKHKTQTSHVNLDKALAAIRQWPGARTDRKVFTIIAEKANDKGVAETSIFTIAMAIRNDIDTVYQSVFRLSQKGFVGVEIVGGIYPPDRRRNPFGLATFTITPAYMLHTATTPEPSDGTERIQNIGKRLDHLTEVVANDDSGKKIVELENRIEKLEHDNKTLRGVLDELDHRLQW